MLQRLRQITPLMFAAVRNSSATTFETASDEPLVVLKATTRTGLLYWPSEQIGDHGFKIGIVNVSR